MVRILFLGEIVGKSGINTIKTGLQAIKDKYQVDYTVANGEGATGGFGIGKAHSVMLSKFGIDLITGAEKLFYKIDMPEFITKASFIIRPLNYPSSTPGRFIKNFELKGKKFAVINLQGNNDLKQNIQNAFIAIDLFLKKLDPSVIALVQFHASPSAEKATMLHFLDGRVAAVIGTHTKVITADYRVTDKGTAYITDNGRVGSFMSVGGFEVDNEIKKLKSQLPLRSIDSYDECMIQGVVVTIDEECGRAISIEPVMQAFDVVKDERSN